MKTKDFNVISRKGRLVLLLVCLVLAALSPAVWGAGPYEISWSTIDGGGGRSSGGQYILTGTTGQPDAGWMTGGNYELLGGFWGGAAVCTVDFLHFARLARQWFEISEPNENKIIASDGKADNDFGCSVSISGDYAIVGASWANGTGTAYIFKREDPNWVQKAKLTPSDGVYMDSFGCAVSISGNYAIVGAFAHSHSVSDAGAVYIFEKPGGEWADATETAKLTAGDPAQWDYFGWAVSISGNYAIIGAHGDDDKGDQSGSAYIFERVGAANWTQQAKLLASDTFCMYDGFGSSVSINDDYAIVGAYGDDDPGAERGSAYIFEKPGGGWVNGNETAKLTASDGGYDDAFGGAVSINGDYAIVGALRNDAYGANSGAAYIFEKPAGSWVNTTETVKLTPSDGAADDRFGISVSISGDRAIIGAFEDDDNATDSGSAYMFKRQDPNWIEQEKLTASDAATNDYFGYRVSVSGNSAVVGALEGDGNETDSGAAYVYTPEKLYFAADLDADDDVDLADLKLFTDEWLCSCPYNWPLK